MKTLLEEIPAHLRRRHFSTGTAELLVGGMLLWGGLSFEIGRHPFLVGLVFMVGVLALGKVIEHIQQKYIYPRSGYVQFHEEASQFWKTALFILAAAILFAFAFWIVFTYDYAHALAWVTPLLATFLGGVMLIIGFYHRVRRMAFVGFLALVLGWILSPPVLGAEATRGYSGLGILVFYFIAIGLVFLTSGGLTLRNYLRATPLQPEAQDE
jgi:MFS family permease